MLPFSSWLFVLFGMLIVDTLLCAWFLKKFSEALLEFTVTILIFVIGKLLERNPIDFLNEGAFVFLAAGAVLAALCVMFYHLFIKIIPASPHRCRKKHQHEQGQTAPVKKVSK